MARVRLISNTQPVVDFSVAGAVVTLRGLAVDCAAYYGGKQRTIEVRADESGHAVIGGDGSFLATIVVPGPRYSDADDGPVLLPLDPNAITITLWPAA